MSKRHLARGPADAPVFVHVRHRLVRYPQPVLKPPCAEIGKRAFDRLEGVEQLAGRVGRSNQLAPRRAPDGTPVSDAPYASWKKVGALRRVEPQSIPEHIARPMHVAALREVRVPRRADAGELGDLLPPEPGRAPPPARRKPDAGRRKPLAAAAEELPELLKARRRECVVILVYGALRSLVVPILRSAVVLLSGGPLHKFIAPARGGRRQAALSECDTAHTPALVSADLFRSASNVAVPAVRREARNPLRGARWRTAAWPAAFAVLAWGIGLILLIGSESGVARAQAAASGPAARTSGTARSPSWRRIEGGADDERRVGTTADPSLVARLTFVNASMAVPQRAARPSAPARLPGQPAGVTASEDLDVGPDGVSPEVPADDRDTGDTGDDGAGTLLPAGEVCPVLGMMLDVPGPALRGRSERTPPSVVWAPELRPPIH